MSQYQNTRWMEYAICKQIIGANHNADPNSLWSFGRKRFNTKAVPRERTFNDKKLENDETILLMHLQSTSVRCLR